jgi:hypothetical protein
MVKTYRRTVRTSVDLNALTRRGATSDKNQNLVAERRGRVLPGRETPSRTVDVSVGPHKVRCGKGLGGRA